MSQHSLKKTLQRVTGEISTLANTSKDLDCSIGRMAHGELSATEERETLQAVDLLRQTLHDLSIVMCHIGQAVEHRNDVQIHMDLTHLHLSDLKHRMQGQIAPTCPDQGDQGDVHLF